MIRVTPRKPTDFPPSGLNEAGVPTGGWWNYGGIQREVYLEKLDTVDYKQVQVRPCCRAHLRVRRADALTLRNVASGTRRVSVTGTFGSRHVNLGTKNMGAGRGRIHRHAADRQAAAVEPADRTCTRSTYRRADGRKVSAMTCTAESARSKVSNGKLVLNGQPLTCAASACTRTPRSRASRSTTRAASLLLKDAKELGATVIRTHYPLHPYTHELAIGWAS